MFEDFIADCQSELGRADTISIWRALKLTHGTIGLKAMLGYRIGKKLQALRSKVWCWPLLAIGWPVYFLLSSYVRIVYDIRIELSSTIGPGLYIGHFGDIRLSHCKIGKYCCISQSVHVRPVAAGSSGPELGDFVWIGAQAKIVGNYKIGDRCTISAGTNASRDLPDRALMMGNPGRMVMRDYDNRSVLRISD